MLIKNGFSLYKQALNLGTADFAHLKFYAMGLIPNPIKKFLIGGDFDMNNFREVNDDMLKDWFEFRDQTVLAYTTREDKKHTIDFDEICERVLRNVPDMNQKYVKKQLELLDRNFMDYVSYWNEKYYRNGFCDGVNLIGRCLKS